jgi:hypothetical protein
LTREAKAVGIEQEYEKNEEEYFQEHTPLGGLVEQVKQLVKEPQEENSQQ